MYAEIILGSFRLKYIYRFQHWFKLLRENLSIGWTDMGNNLSIGLANMGSNLSIGWTNVGIQGTT